MRVLMYYSNRDVRLEEMAVPEIGPGELLMKVVASGICGSDVMEWYRRDKVPLVLGHEVAGEVVEVGPGVEKFHVGDRITATHHVPCNTCHYCLNGHPTVCETLLRGTHFDPGGFAEYVRVPAINVDRGVFPIPDGLSYEKASFMEPLACVFRGQRNARLKPGQSVLVLGSGISGLLHIGLARALGAALVVAADTIPFRLEKAKEMGAHVTLSADETLVEKLRGANDGLLADLVILCFDGFIPLAMKCVERGGTVLFFGGASENATVPATINELFWRTEITLTSTYAGSPVDCVTALRLINAGDIPVEAMVTHRLGLEEATKAFQWVASPVEHDCIKVIVEPHHGEK
ncbi:MAG: alcohol dehydrogenase catalytic domain-containing protein [Deltaproteobacteria bacterium]|nr:alcohol dehydrogenase catalytic domain-containing protein [Deltaproteobacteria bacterium]